MDEPTDNDDGCEISYLTEEDVDRLVTEALADCGATLEELRRQHRLGRLESERHRRTRFAINGFGRG